MSKEYYIYLHIKTNGEPFYVGKGKGNRCFSKHGRSKQWYYITNDNEYDVIILDENLSEFDAYFLEKYWIKRIGRKNSGGPLINIASGGGGSPGYKFSDEHRLKISLSNKGKNLNIKRTEQFKLNQSIKKIEHYVVLQIDKNNNIIKVWDSHHLAAIFVKGYPNNILRVCRGFKSINTYKGFKWKFKK